MILGSVDTQQPKQKTIANIDADQVATNQQAIPVPYVAGRRRVPLHFIAPVYNQRSEKVTVTTGKDQTSTVGFIYFGDIAGIVCIGGRLPVGHIRRHIVDSQIAWEGDVVRDTDFYEPITLDDYGLTRIYWGYPLQPVDDLVLTPLSSTIPPGVDPRDTSTWPGGDETARHP